MSFAYSPLDLTGAGGAGGAGRVTVGASGATYTSVEDALTAGVNVFSIITDLTEEQLITVPDDGLEISIENGTFNIGTGYFDVGGNQLKLEGNGTLAYGSVVGTLISGVAGAALTVNGLTIDNNSGVTTCLSNIDYARFSNVIFLGNVRICGNQNIYEGCIYRSSTLLIPTGISNTLIDGSIFDTVLVQNSGTNTVISDAVVY